MEFFLPGLFLFLISLAITAWVAPKATPVMAAILSAVFLTYGVYHHQKLFAAEYRLSTWQEGLKIYAPAIMILAVLIVVFYGILSFFTSGKVPVPTLPNVSLPTPDSITGTLTNSMESIGNSFTNRLNSLTSIANNNANSLMNSIGNSIGLNQNQNQKNKGNISRSFLETV
jgi:predicted PurR-regulated permease PerM